VDGLAGKNVVGAAAGHYHTAAWTAAGELFTFGDGNSGRLGHGGNSFQYVPKLVDALAGTKVVGACAAAGSCHSAAWTEAGELFTFGSGVKGELGHGMAERELMPRLVEGLAGKTVIGAAAGHHHTAVWTDEGEIFSFGDGTNGRLGHGVAISAFAPRLVEGVQLSSELIEFEDRRRG